MSASTPSITVIGDAEFGQFGPAAYHPNSYGLDTATIKYQGRADKLEQFKARLVALKWQPISLFAQYFQGTGAMYLRSWTNDEAKDVVTVSLEFVGRADGLDSIVEPKDGKTQQTASGTIIDPEQNVRNLEIIYLPPRTTYKWISLKKRDDSPYTTVRIQVELWKTIFSFRIVPASGKSLIPSERVTSFDRVDIVPNIVFEYTAVVDKIYLSV